MSAPVPYKRTYTQINDILISEPVRAQTWRELGMQLHWLRAHGMQIIPCHAPQVSIASTATPESLFYKVKPQGLAIARVWVFQFRQEEWTDAGVPAELKITLPTGGTSTIYPPVRTGIGGTGTILQEVLSSKSSAETDLELKFERISGTENVTIESVTCYELPRAVLALDGTDLGVDFETLRPNASIFDSTNRGLGAVAENLTDAVSWPRRMLWQQSFPLIDSDPGGAGNPTAWVDLFTLPVPILPRRVAVGDTTFTVTWNIRLVVAGAGDTYEARITTGNNADTNTLTFAGITTEAWGVSNGTVALDCEDVGTADGVPSGGLETVQIAVRRTAGTGKVSVRSVACWEAS